LPQINQNVIGTSSVHQICRCKQNAFCIENNEVKHQNHRTLVKTQVYHGDRFADNRLSKRGLFSIKTANIDKKLIGTPSSLVRLRKSKSVTTYLQRIQSNTTRIS
jgi:hypothetical protein